MDLKVGKTFVGLSGLNAKVTKVTKTEVEFTVERRWKDGIENRTRVVKIRDLCYFLAGYKPA